MKTTPHTEDEILTETQAIAGDLFDAISNRSATASIIALSGALREVLRQVPANVRPQMRANIIKDLRRIDD